MDGSLDLAKFGRNLRTNIMRSQTEIAKRVGQVAKAEVITTAPEWKGTLKNRVAMKLFPTSHKAEIMMASPLFNMIALQNEFNTKGPRKLYKSSYPKLEEWANEKGIFLDKPYVMVGQDPGTHLGRQNKFFYPAFLTTDSLVPQIVEKVIRDVALRTRG